MESVLDEKSSCTGYGNEESSERDEEVDVESQEVAFWQVGGGCSGQFGTEKTQKVHLMEHEKEMS